MPLSQGLRSASLTLPLLQRPHGHHLALPFAVVSVVPLCPAQRGASPAENWSVPGTALQRNRMLHKISGDLGRKTGHGFWKSRLYSPGGITTFITTFTRRWLPGTEQGGIQQQFDDEHHKQHAALSLLWCMLRHTHHFKHRHIDQRAPNAGLGKNIRISPEGREPHLSWQQLPGTFQQK